VAPTTGRSRRSQRDGRGSVTRVEIFALSQSRSASATASWRVSYTGNWSGIERSRPQDVAFVPNPLAGVNPLQIAVDEGES